jgi:hypothetical protein
VPAPMRDSSSIAPATAAEATASAAADGADRAAIDVTAHASDVLYVLENDAVSSRSRVVQWWRVNQGPLMRYARQSARLFPLPPATQQ